MSRNRGNGVLIVAEATPSKAQKTQSRTRQAAHPRRSVCFIAAKSDHLGRCTRLAEAVQTGGYPVAVYETSEFLRAPNPDFEAYVFHHPSAAYSQLRNVVTALQKLGRVIICDWELPLFCDEIYGVEHPGDANSPEPRRTTDYVAALKLFPRVSAANPAIAELASLYQPEAQLVTVPESISPRQKAIADALQASTTKRNPKALGFVCRDRMAAANFGLVHDLVCKLIAEDSERHLTIFGHMDLDGPLANHPRVTFKPALSPSAPNLDLTSVGCVVEPSAIPTQNRCATRANFLHASLAGCQYVATPLPDLAALKAPNLKFATTSAEWHDQLRNAVARATSAQAARSAASYVKKNHSSAAALSPFQTLLY